MTDQEFIRRNILGHVANYDNGKVARAFQGCDASNCEVRQYSSDSPNWARFFSNTMRSPDGGFWWSFTAAAGGHWMLEVSQGGEVVPDEEGVPDGEDEPDWEDVWEDLEPPA